MALKYAFFAGILCGLFFFNSDLFLSSAYRGKETNQLTHLLDNGERIQVKYVLKDKIRPGLRPNGLLADYLKQIKANQTMSFWYTGANNQTASRSLKLSAAQAKQLGWDEPIDYIKLTEENVKRFAFATAASDKYYNYSLAFLETVLKVKPNHTVYFYDIGLNSAQIQKVKGMESCGIKYRKFHFENYPEHVKTLNTCAWKQIIIMEVLRYELGVFWADTSLRFLTGNFSRMHDAALRNDGIVTLSTQGHSTFPVTHPGMYDFLPVNTRIAMREPQQEAGLVFYYRTKFVMERFLFWSVLCALNQECISPHGAKRRCTLPGRNNTKVTCHRYDQSVLNILILNEFRFSNRTNAGDRETYDLKRKQMPSANVSGCVKEAMV